MHELLRDRLAAANIDLTVIYGQSCFEDSAPSTCTELPWGTPIANRRVRLGGRELFWQPALRELDGADLVIVEQASKLLINYVLLVQQQLGWKRLAFWGHGFTARKRGGTAAGELLKRYMSRRVHWWFAYNEQSVRAVKSLGFPMNRITNVQNALDTTELTAAIARLGDADLADIRCSIGVVGSHVGIYVGAMYEDKMLGYLLEACKQVRARIADFEMIFVGAGPDQHLVSAAAASHTWIHFVGPRFGEEKARYLALADVALVPGALGLVVLDAFAAEVPPITVADRWHGPEVEYLEDGLNGIVVPATARPTEYADQVGSLLSSSRRLERLRAGCRVSRDRYTVDHMVARFAHGIELALSA